MMTDTAKKYVLGITGASGAPYAVRLLEVLLSTPCEVQLSISPAAVEVIRQELGLEIDLMDFRLETLVPGCAKLPGKARYFHYQNLLAPMASGSALTDGMVICPCSGGTLSSIANAASGNLIQRAADVHLKERRKLILVPRETPLSLPQIDNLRRCTEAGAVVLPASPGFYNQPKSIADLVDFVVARICDQLGVEHRLTKRWGGE